MVAEADICSKPGVDLGDIFVGLYATLFFLFQIKIKPAHYKKNCEFPQKKNSFQERWSKLIGIFFIDFLVMYISFSKNRSNLFQFFGGGNFPHSLFRLVIQFKFSPTWSCVSLLRPTTSSEWKLHICLVWGQTFANPHVYTLISLSITLAYPANKKY